MRVRGRIRGRGRGRVGVQARVGLAPGPMLLQVITVVLDHPKAPP